MPRHQRQPWQSFSKPPSASWPSTRTDILFNGRVFADQLFGDAAIPREDDEARGIDVQPASRRQPLACSGWNSSPRSVLIPAVLCLEKNGRGLVAVPGLAGNVAHRFMHENGDRPALLVLAAESIVMVWSGSMREPSSETTWPSTRTQLLAIHSSASRREANPSSTCV